MGLKTENKDHKSCLLFMWPIWAHVLQSSFFWFLHYVEIMMKTKNLGSNLKLLLSTIYSNLYLFSPTWIVFLSEVYSRIFKCWIIILFLVKKQKHRRGTTWESILFLRKLCNKTGHSKPRLLWFCCSKNCQDSESSSKACETLNFSKDWDRGDSFEIKFESKLQPQNLLIVHSWGTSLFWVLSHIQYRNKNFGLVEICKNLMKIIQDLIKITHKVLGT